MDAELQDHWSGTPSSETIAATLVVLNNNALLRDDIEIGDVEEFRARVRRARLEARQYVATYQTKKRDRTR